MTKPPGDLGCCRDCAYALLSHEYTSFHECRASSPSVGARDPVAVWPLVHDTDWCGRYQDRPVEPTP